MDIQEIEEYIAAIMWGKRIVTLSDGRVFVFRSPTVAEKSYAHFVYKASLEKHKAEGVLQSSDDLIAIARHQGEWTDVDSNYLDKFEEIINFANGQMAETINTIQKKRIQKQIDQAYHKKHEVSMKYAYLTGHSIEQQAAEEKVRILVRCTAERIDGVSIWLSDEEFGNETDHGLLAELVSLYVSKDDDLNTKKIREIARSAQWRIRWAAGKENISTLFGVDVRDLSDTQFALMYWSQVYDSVYMSMECPPDDVIADDEKLDEWLKNREKEQDSKRRNQSMDKTRKGFYDKDGKFYTHGKKPTDHKEVGLVVDGEFDENGVFRHYTPEEKRAKIEEIQKYNTPDVRRLLQGEHKRLQKDGVLREEKLRQGRSRWIMGSQK